MSFQVAVFVPFNSTYCRICLPWSTRLFFSDRAKPQVLDVLMSPMSRCQRPLMMTTLGVDRTDAPGGIKYSQSASSQHFFTPCPLAETFLWMWITASFQSCLTAAVRIATVQLVCDPLKWSVVYIWSFITGYGLSVLVSRDFSVSQSSRLRSFYRPGEVKVFRKRKQKFMKFSATVCNISRLGTVHVATLCKHILASHG